MDPTTATPNAEPTQPQADQDRTAGQAQDAPVGLTQAQLDAIIANEKAEVRRRLQREYGDLDDLKAAKEQLTALQQKELTEAQRMQQQLEDLQKQMQAKTQEAELARLDTLRLRVGQELGLPPVLAARLQGTNEEEMKADATNVLTALRSGTTLTFPNIDAAAGSGQAGTKPTPKLSPSEVAAAQAAGMTLEQYAELKAKLEE